MSSLAEPRQHEAQRVDSPESQPAPDNWLTRWCATSSLEQRLIEINAMSKKRLPTYAAAEVWLHLLGKVTGLVSAEQMELLLRQFILLAPEHGKTPMMYDLLMNGQAPDANTPELVFMITSCKKYMPQAQRVLRDLQARGADACIVIGDPTLSVAVQDGPLVTLPVADTYEALPSKVLEGLTYLRRRHGSISIMKIDDDMTLTDRLDPAALAHTARVYEYAGEVIGDHVCDRFWHCGKTSVPVPIYTKRQQGRLALGAMYLLGPRAVEHLVREWVMFPGEFAGHLYEDRAVGDALRKANIEVASIDIERMGG
ncbi:MAG: hypothetical protein ABI781_05855, partial [Burkholderiales bacterium]